MAQTSDQEDGGHDKSNAQASAPTTSSNNTQTTSTNVSTTLIDKDFDPSAQALIDEMDDERTLEEEEALAGTDSTHVQNELDDLKRESEMPIEELLAYYERMRNEAATTGGGEDDESELDDDECDEDEDDDEEAEDDDDDEGADDERPNQPNESSMPSGLADVRSDQDGASMASADRQATSSYRPMRALSLEEGGGYLVHIPESLMARALAAMSSSDSSPGYSTSDDSDERRAWQREIHVGPEYQAEVPEGLSAYENDLPPYENEDVLVWKCNPEQNQDQIHDYLKQAAVIPKRNDISLSPASVPKISDLHMRLYREKISGAGSVSSGQQNTEPDHENIINTNPSVSQTDVYMLQSRKRLRIDGEIERDIAVNELMEEMNLHEFKIDMSTTATREVGSNSDSRDNRPELSTDEYFQGEEQLLYLLLQCNHNFKEALRRRTLDPFKYYISEPMSLWSQDECLGFEHGLRTYGKDFRLVRDNKVSTRTRAEVVAFYYLWKKSERYDVYTNQYRIVRKRCLTHPGTTDYMDKFIEDNESALNASSSTPTPTPTESTIENNRVSQISHVDSQPISICHTSEAGAPLTECLNLPGKLSAVSDCGEQVGDHHQANSDDNAQSNPYYISSNPPIK